MTRGFVAGNAAIVLRSRLKVRVLKENRDKRARVDEQGVILTNGDAESSRKDVQYQVRAENAQLARDVIRKDLTRWMFCKGAPRSRVPQCTRVQSRFRWYIPSDPQACWLPSASLLLEAGMRSVNMCARCFIFLTQFQFIHQYIPQASHCW